MLARTIGSEELREVCCRDLAGLSLSKLFRQPGCLAQKSLHLIQPPVPEGAVRDVDPEPGKDVFRRIREPCREKLFYLDDERRILFYVVLKRF